MYQGFVCAFVYVYVCVESHSELNWQKILIRFFLSFALKQQFQKRKKKNEMKFKDQNHAIFFFKFQVANEQFTHSNIICAFMYRRLYWANWMCKVYFSLLKCAPCIRQRWKSTNGETEIKAQHTHTSFNHVCVAIVVYVHFYSLVALQNALRSYPTCIVCIKRRRENTIKPINRFYTHMGYRLTQSLVYCVFLPVQTAYIRCAQTKQLYGFELVWVWFPFVMDGPPYSVYFIIFFFSTERIITNFFRWVISKSLHCVFSKRVVLHTKLNVV